ncbi:MAG: zinc ABC transporter substrate-binding protein [Cyanobacteria bacterium J06632_22]
MRRAVSGLGGFATGLMLSLGLAGCNLASPEAGPSAEEPQVVVTSTVLANLVETVGGDEAVVQRLLAPGDDPHIYEPTPRDTVALEEADIVFYNGYNLEPELIRIIEGTSVTAATVPLAESIPPLSFQYDGQTEPDPHVWGDVENAIALTESIRDTLIDLNPDAEATYRANAEALIAELAQLDDWIETQVATIPPEQRLLVTTHDAFQYYTNAYGLEMLGTLIGISTEEQPSAQTVQQLVDAIRTAGVPAIFAETTINPQLISTVAEEANVQLAPTELYSDSLGAPGSSGETYVGMMVSNTETVVSALGGQVQSFQSE